jgi:hypothetical protein
LAWSEDRALLRSNPSADQGPRPKGKAAVLRAAALPTLRDWHQAINLRGRMPRLPRHGCLNHSLSQLAGNSNSR